MYYVCELYIFYNTFTQIFNRWKCINNTTVWWIHSDLLRPERSCLGPAQGRKSWLRMRSVVEVAAGWEWGPLRNADDYLLLTKLIKETGKFEILPEMPADLPGTAVCLSGTLQMFLHKRQPRRWIQTSMLSHNPRVVLVWPGVCGPTGNNEMAAWNRRKRTKCQAGFLSFLFLRAHAAVLGATSSAI